MLDTQNTSPRQLAAVTALILSIPISLGILVLEHNWLVAAVACVIIFTASFLLIRYIIQRYIARKIKLIYKFIYQTKATKRQEAYYKYILPQKSIDEVQQDVEAWAARRSHEIEALKKAEAFRKEFLQNLSHEFKTPVFAIQGFIQTLLNGALENPEVNRRFLEKADRNVERLVHLIEDLDAISRMERGEIRLHQQNFVIQDLVREVFETLSLKGEQAGIQFCIKKGCDQPLAVWGDPEKIRQVLSNLVDNSIKYGRRGGTTMASIYNTDGQNILIEISDDGMGIEDQNLTRIFERFFRTTEGRSRDVGGRGLGLAICKHIVEAHGHNIHVRSKIDIGTTIGFTLDTAKKNMAVTAHL